MEKGRMMRWLVAAVIVAVLTVAAVAVMAGGDSNVQAASLNGQGGGELMLAGSEVMLERSDDRLVVQLEAGTPEPGSYEYPTGDMVPGWSTEHPELVPGRPEVFTTWVVVFNRPELCTDDVCNADDFAPEAAAEGGIYLGDGTIADGDRITMSGEIAVGQRPETGSPLEFPLIADVHVILAPHGKALAGTDLARQLTGPVGNPSLWWGVEFEGSR